MTKELYEAIVAAEQAARKAHDLSYESPRASLPIRLALGSVQSKLMRYVVKYTGTRPDRFEHPLDRAARERLADAAAAVDRLRQVSGREV